MLSPTTYRAGLHGERAEREALAKITEAKARDPKLLPAPSGLDEDESRIWTRLALELHGVIEPTDAPMLEVLVQWLALSERCSSALSDLTAGSLEYARTMRSVQVADRIAVKLAKSFFLDGAMRFDLRAMARSMARRPR